MKYRPNAYFIWNKDDDSKFYWNLFVQGAPDSPVIHVLWFPKKRKSVAKLKGDIAEFTHKYQVSFSCNCFTLRRDTWIKGDYHKKWEKICWKPENTKYCYEATGNLADKNDRK